MRILLQCSFRLVPNVSIIRRLQYTSNDDKKLLLYTNLLQTHLNIVQIFSIHMIRAEDQVLTETSFQFLHNDANQPLLLAGRQLS